MNKTDRLSKAPAPKAASTGGKNLFLPNYMQPGLAAQNLNKSQE